MIRAAIWGASGYSGAELLRFLLRHPLVKVERVFAQTTVGKKVAELYPIFNGRTELVFEPWEPEGSVTASDPRVEELDVAFLALPSGEAMRVVPHLIPRVKKVIDLSGDFRLKEVSLYEQYYRRKHTAEELLTVAVYGLPELNREEIRKAKIIANPGCYPTGVLLALVPALKLGIVDPEEIVVNSLSGVSGAGRSAAIEMSFVEVNENVRAYKIGFHQHIPEIINTLEAVTGLRVRLTFIPHLVPLNRGIYTTIAASLTAEINEEGLREMYRNFYASSPFVRISQRRIPEIKDVLGTNYCDIGFAIDHQAGRLVIISVIDNLGKGAAGQAVQNMNIMFGIPEGEGLIA